MKYYALVLVILVSIAPASVVAPASSCADLSLEKGGLATGTSAPAKSEPALTVVSLNMAKESRKDRVIEDLRRASLLAKADVWMFQESGAVQEIAKETGMNYAYAPSEMLDEGNTSGLAILSRYPLADSKRIPLPRYNLGFHSRCRIALSATVQSPAGPVRVINAHLDTRLSLDQRLRQAMPLLDMEDDSLPTIVGGDFNTANIRWIGNVLPLPGQKQAEAIRALFIHRGFDSPLDSTANTFKLIGLPLHLDWIFAKHLKSVSSGIENIGFSDHNAVWVDLQIE